MTDLQSSPTNISKASSAKNIKYSFSDQFIAVFIKSWTNQRRQYKTNICQIAFPLALILILYLLQLLVTSIIQSQLGEFTPAVTTPPLTPNTFLIPLPSGNNCSTNFSSPQPEVGNILYVDNNIAEVGTSGGVPNPTGVIPPPNYTITTNSTGLLGNITVPVALLAGFPVQTLLQEGLQLICYNEPMIIFPFFERIGSKSELDSVIYRSWYQDTPYLAGFQFGAVDMNAGVLNYSVFYNKTLTNGRDIPLLMTLITSAWWRSVVNFSPLASYIMLGTKNFPTPQTENNFDIISLVGPIVYIYIFNLLFPVILAGLVFEKENKLREIMRMMGLKTYVYWLVTYLFYYLMYLIATLLLITVAIILGFRFFLVNNFFCVFFLFFLWGHTMLATAFFLSVFFTSTRTATVVGYIYVFAMGLLSSQLIQQYFDSSDTPPEVIFVISIIPPFAFYRGLLALSKAVSFGGPGMTISEMSQYPYYLDQTFGFLAVTWAVLMILALYLEAVVPIGPGVKKHPLFFLPKKCRKRKKKSETTSSSQPNEPEDVAKERQRIYDGVGNSVIRIIDLRKVFPGPRGMPKKVAVDNLTMGIEVGECFGFLGPNGAGKSTTINMLCGYLRPTSGTAEINGMDITVDMDQIHLQMGVCPQENVLWDDLTGPEHLEFYGRLKNFRGKELKEQVDYWLGQVNLLRARSKLTKQYSGGMKRRLSVAIALIGNPKVVLLDEPTTYLLSKTKHELITISLSLSTSLTSTCLDKCEVVWIRHHVVHFGM